MITSPAVDALTAAMGTVRSLDSFDLDDSTLLGNAEQLLTLRAQLDAVITREVQVLESRDVTATQCGRCTRNWLMEDELQPEVESAVRVRVARHLPLYVVLAAAL